MKNCAPPEDMQAISRRVTATMGPHYSSYFSQTMVSAGLILNFWRENSKTFHIDVQDNFCCKWSLGCDFQRATTGIFSFKAICLPVLPRAIDRQGKPPILARFGDKRPRVCVILHRRRNWRENSNVKLDPISIFLALFWCFFGQFQSRPDDKSVAVKQAHTQDVFVTIHYRVPET